MTRNYGFKEFQKSLTKNKNESVAAVIKRILWKLHKLEVRVDKEMRKQVGKPLRKAEKIIKKAEKSNAKLANKDERIRDPLIKKAKKVMKRSACRA